MTQVRHNFAMDKPIKLEPGCEHTGRMRRLADEQRQLIHQVPAVEGKLLCYYWIIEALYTYAQMVGFPHTLQQRLEVTDPNYQLKPVPSEWVREVFNFGVWCAYRYKFNYTYLCDQVMTECPWLLVGARGTYRTHTKPAMELADKLAEHLNYKQVATSVGLHPQPWTQLGLTTLACFLAGVRAYETHFNLLAKLWWLAKQRKSQRHTELLPTSPDHGENVRFATVGEFTCWGDYNFTTDEHLRMLIKKYSWGGSQVHNAVVCCVEYEPDRFHFQDQGMPDRSIQVWRGTKEDVVPGGEE